MQEIHKEQNKDRTNITVFPFCLRLQYGSIWHYFCQWHRNERKKRECEGRLGKTTYKDSLWDHLSPSGQFPLGGGRSPGCAVTFLPHPLTLPSSERHPAGGYGRRPAPTQPTSFLSSSAIPPCSIFRCSAQIPYFIREYALRVEGRSWQPYSYNMASPPGHSQFSHRGDDLTRSHHSLCKLWR